MVEYSIEDFFRWLQRYSIEDFFRWLQRIKKEFEDFEDNGDWCMSEKRFYLGNDEWVKFDYSEIREYIDEEPTPNLLRNDEVCDLLNEQQNTISRLKKENEQLRQFINKGRRLSVKELMDNINENELLKRKIRGLEKENEELKRERDDWKSSTCSYMNKDSVLSMDCQIVQEALWELEKEIEFGSKREDLFFDLKEKFEKLNNHRIGVFE